MGSRERKAAAAKVSKLVKTILDPAKIVVASFDQDIQRGKLPVSSRRILMPLIAAIYRVEIVLADLKADRQ